jgi:hypothetical protein
MLGYLVGYMDTLEMFRALLGIPVGYMDVKEGYRDMLGYLVTCVDALKGSRALLGRAGQSCGAWCATRGSWRVQGCAGVLNMVLRLHGGVQSLAGVVGLVNGCHVGVHSHRVPHRAPKHGPGPLHDLCST